jgi:predicted methyltransferase MtxX (methanogen marker protein 4)
LFERIVELSKDMDITVGIGMAREGDAAHESAKVATSRGLGPVETFTDPAELVYSLVDGRVGAVVRGTLSAHDILPPLLDALGKPSANRVAVIERSGGGAVLLTPVGIDEGRDLDERWNLLKGATELAASMGIEPRVAIMSMGRPEDIDRGEAISISVRECETMRSAAEVAGLTAICVGIRLERAIEEGDVVVTPDGVTGNLIFRALHYVGGFESWGAVSLSALPAVYIDTSRDKGAYLGPIELARAVASRVDPQVDGRVG